MSDQIMLAAVFLSQNDRSVEIKSVPVPTPGPGQILIRVETAGVNFSDIKRKRGDAYPFATQFPFIPGSEIAGDIVALGEGVTSLDVGATVMALAGDNGFGGMAQFAVAYAQTATAIPPGLSPEIATTFLVAGATAMLMLTRTVGLRTGESIFIPSAAGGVGSYAVQIAKMLGAGIVIGGVGSDDKLQAAREVGADHVLNIRRAGWQEEVRKLVGGAGVDVALESSGESGLAETLAILAPFGRLVVYGAASGRSAVVNDQMIEEWLYAPAPNQQITGFNIGGWFMQRPVEAGAAMGELVGAVMSGKIKPPMITARPLQSAQEVLVDLEKGVTTGKIVLKPWA